MATANLTTSRFWAAAFERAVRTFAQTLIAALGLDTTDVLHVPWERGLALAGTAALLSVLTSVAAAAAGTGGDGPGITETPTAGSNP